MYKKIRDGEYKNIGKVSYTLLCIVAALNIILMICAPEIIAIMAPPSYNEAIWVIPPVAMSVYFMFMYSLFANFEFYYEKTHFMMIASVSGAILNIVLNYIFIRIYGFIAAGFTTLACYIFYCVAHYLVMKHILRTALPHYVIYNMKTISLITGVFVVLGFSSLILYSYPVERYALILLTITTCVIFRNRLKMCLMTMALLKNNPNK